MASSHSTWSGPHEVFQRAGGYDCAIVAPSQGRCALRAACRCTPGTGVAGLRPTGIDTLVVVGGAGVYARQA
ncbi:hypothetical protein [Nonomuraea dietziae]|uniref:hypothetical protein n=1 Tax=Nonomuraea dietziae TaxID=65515 RepID=UPI0031DA99BD